MIGLLLIVAELNSAILFVHLLTGDALDRAAPRAARQQPEGALMLELQQFVALKTFAAVVRISAPLLAKTKTT